MVVPVSLDPGYRDPRSPYYRPTKAERERKRQQELEAERAEAQAKEMARKHRIRCGFQMIFGDQ